MPRFQPYLARDSSNPKTPEEWATELYNAASDPDYINNNIVHITNLETTHSKLNCLSMMLYILDPTKSYARDLTQLVLIKLRIIITENIGKLDPEIVNDEKFNSDVLGQLRDFLENGKVGSMGHEALEQWAKDYEEASKEIGIKDFDEMQDWWLDVSKSAVSFFNSLFQLPYWKRLGNWQEQFEGLATKTFATKCMMMLCQGASMGIAIYSFVGTVKNWNKASLSTKVATVSSGLEIAFRGVSGATEVFDALARRGINGRQNLPARNQFDNALNNLEHAQDEIRVWGREVAINNSDSDSSDSFEDLAMDGAAEVVGEGEEAVTRWTTISKITGKIGRALGIVAGACVMIATGLDLAKNWDTMSTKEKTLDIINIAAMGIGMIAQGMALAGELKLIRLSDFMAETVVPVVGGFVAVVGFVIALVLIFTHKAPPPPDTPLDTYIKKTIVPFIQTLPQPSADWLKDHKSN